MKQAVKLLGWLTGYQGRGNPPFMEAPNHGAILTICRVDGSDDLICMLNSEEPMDQVWLGLPHKWLYFYSGAEFRKMAAWALWRWAWGDWFGLKTRLWLWTLGQRM